MEFRGAENGKILIVNKTKAHKPQTCMAMHAFMVSFDIHPTQ